MKIHIKTSEGRVINIPVPMSLALMFLKKGALKADKNSVKEAVANAAAENVGGALNVDDDLAEDDDLADDAAPDGMDREDLKKLIKGLKEAKKVWGHLKIVEVFSADGEEVTITL